jgi:hypothetical protein
MHPYGGIEVGPRLNESNRSGVARHIAGTTDHDNLVHTRFTRMLDNSFDFTAIFLALNMGVTID